MRSRKTQAIPARLEAGRRRFEQWRGTRKGHARIPHSAFRGQTPDEMYFGTGDRVPDQLDAPKKIARQSRMKVNRATSCPRCQPLVALAS